MANDPIDKTDELVPQDSCAEEENSIDYEWFEKEDYRESPHLIGVRMIKAGLLTRNQRDELLKKQSELKEDWNKHVRFGQLAVEQGYCAKTDVESLPGFIGEQLINAGFLTVEQHNALIEWQEKLRQDGIFIRYGELTVNEGFCTHADVEMLIPYKHKNHS